jgi:ribonuclease HI
MVDFEVYTDGAARGNPGPAAIGYAVYDSGGRLIEKASRFVGRRTNSEAEYEALLWAIERASKLTSGRVKFYSDSEFMVRQVRGVYRANDDRMRGFLSEVRESIKLFDSFEIVHVRREDPKITLVDGLVNAALTEKGFPKR